MALCAVIASIDGGELAACASAAGFAEVISVRDGLSALRRLRERTADALVADAVLPGLDGLGLFRRVLESPLRVHPAMVLALPEGMSAPPHEEFAAVERPLSVERVRAALESQRPENRAVPEEKRRRAREALSSLGVPNHRGTDCLARAVELAWLDGRYLSALTSRLYPAVGRSFGMDGRAVERAIRYVIDAAWRMGEIEAQYQIFGNTVDARRGSPTCGEMIARIADILRWEGRA